MYTLTPNAIASLLVFINKIPDSIVKSKYEKWFAEVEPTERITSEQMEYFVGLSTHLPVELQNFPQGFCMAAKNSSEHTNSTDNKAGHTVENADLIELVDETIDALPDSDAPDNEEETLHKLASDEKPSKSDKSVQKSKKK